MTKEYIIIDPATGEKITTLNEGDKIIRKKSIDKFNELKVKYIINWKSNKNIQFIKIYRRERINHMKNTDLTAYAKAFLFDMELYIEYKTNMLVNENNEPMTNNDIMKITKLNKNTLAKVIKELQEKHYIKVTGNTKNRKIYVNPYLYCAGNMIEKDVVLLFDDYRIKYDIDISQYLDD